MERIWPLFVNKVKDGKELPPHKDWVKNVFLPRKEKALRRAEKTVERLEKRGSIISCGLTMRCSELRALAFSYRARLLSDRLSHGLCCLP